MRRVINHAIIARKEMSQISYLIRIYTKEEPRRTQVLVGKLEIFKKIGNLQLSELMSLDSFYTPLKTSENLYYQLISWKNKRPEFSFKNGVTNVTLAG